MHTRAREDITEIFERLNKMDNNSAMKDILGSSALSGDSIDMILKAINDMQDKINSGLDEKL